MLRSHTSRNILRTCDEVRKPSWLKNVYANPSGGRSPRASVTSRQSTPPTSTVRGSDIWNPCDGRHISGLCIELLLRPPTTSVTMCQLPSSAS